MAVSMSPLTDSTNRRDADRNRSHLQYIKPSCNIYIKPSGNLLRDGFHMRLYH